MNFSYVEIHIGVSHPSFHGCALNLQVMKVAVGDGQEKWEEDSVVIF